MIISVAFSRVSLSLPDLVIDNDPSGDYTISEDGIPTPSFSMRRTYAPDSAWVGGRQLLDAVAEAGSLSLAFQVNGSSAANAETLKNAVDAATSQFSYDVIVDIDGQTRTWAADPELPTWFADSGMVRAHLWRGSITIPLNPV